jgi:hypothetical protein
MDYEDKFEKDIIDIDEIGGTDLKINPEFYIHNAILKAQTALTKDNTKEGFLQFIVIVEHIEVLTRAANYLPDDYEEKIKDFQDTKEYKDEEEKLNKKVKLANKKIELLMGEVFNSKTSTDPLKLK